MTQPNAQLEAALARFSHQPGVTSDQIAQLRAAVVADAAQLQLLNQQARAGHLKGFALQAPGDTTPNQAGRYDLQSGLVTLPPASFQAAGTHAGADLIGTVKLQQMSVAFAHSTWPERVVQPGQAPQTVQHAVTQDMVDNLQSAINGSPVLAAEMRKAVYDTSGGHGAVSHLDHFAFLPPGVSAGATYDGDHATMNLPTYGLQTNSATNPKGNYDTIDMTFVLGHETQHGFDHAAAQAATSTFLNRIRRQAAAPGPDHDYTDELRDYIQSGRKDEATAEIAGWNALLSKLKQGNPSANIDDMLSLTNSRRLDFVERDNSTGKARALPGLNFNADGTLALKASDVNPALVTSTGKTAADIANGNIAAMGQHYFDRPAQAYATAGQRAVHLGENPNPAQTTDYTNYYATWAVREILKAEDAAQAHRHGTKPRIVVDAASIGLHEDLIEQNGLDLGSNKTPRDYYDSSQTPATLHHFDHTKDASMHHDHQYVPVAPSESAAASAVPLSDMRDPVHPHNGMYTQALGRIADSQGRRDTPTESDQRLAAGLTVASVSERLPQISHVLFAADGSRAFAVDTENLQAEWRRRASVEVGPALKQSVEASSQQLEQVVQQQRTQDQLAQTLAPTQGGPDDPTRGGPVR